MTLQDVCAHQRDGFVNRKVMTIVLQDNQVQSRDWAAGHIAVSHVDLFRSHRSINQVEIHGAGLAGELQAVCRAKPGKAIRSFEKFVAEPRARAGKAVEIADGAKAESLC